MQYAMHSKQHHVMQLDLLTSRFKW